MRDQVLVPVQASVSQVADPVAAVAEVLAQLEDGPSERDRSVGLSTALGPDATIHLAGLEGEVARIDVVAGDQQPAPSRVPLAVAQIVLTVTSVPGVGSVLVTRDGSPVELPLPGGALTGAPVTAQDYASLVGPPTTASTNGRQGSTATTG
ncbi:MAG: GerMN domain-containing protein [Pedococcus sp.]